MADRLIEIFNALPCCGTFADIGCDHGYISLMMLKQKKCKSVIISDISEKSLSKAETLLGDYIKQGVVQSFVSDGFDNVPDCDLALIAGMGGEQITDIINRRKNLPEKLVLQPMKNLPKVREFVVKSGYKVLKDYVFYSEKKYYNLLVLQKGKDSLSPEEIKFGRTNLKERPKDFIKYLYSEIAKIDGYLTAENVTEKARSDLQNKRKELLTYAENQ